MRMKEERAAEEAMLRRMACAYGGAALEHEAAAAAAREDAREERRRWYKPCDICFGIRKRAALQGDPEAAFRLCSKCHTRMANLASEEVRKFRPTSAGPSSSRDGLSFEPTSTPARGHDALEAGLRDAEACLALARGSKERLEALHTASQLRLALESAPRPRPMLRARSGSGGGGRARPGPGVSPGEPVPALKTSTAARARVAKAAEAARPSTAPGHFNLDIPRRSSSKGPEHPRFVGISRPKTKPKTKDTDPLMSVSP